MQLLHTDSLAKTVDACNDALLFDHTRCKNARRRAAVWIASRVGQPGGYHGLPALTPSDCRGAYVLFTGEKVSSDAARRHVLGEEACRVMRMMVVNDDRLNRPDVVAAVREAERELVTEILDSPANRKDGSEGTFCCGTCSVALWRNLLAGGMNRRRERLKSGLGILKAERDGKGRWKRFPYWYTLSALIEMPGRLPDEEIEYAAPGCERLLRRTEKDDPHERRRREIARRALQRAGVLADSVA
jgi:hypothetical protein